MPTNTLQRLALLARRRYGWIFLATLVLVATSLFLASRLSVNSDYLSLLPRDEPRVDTLRRTLEEFGSLDLLLVAVRIPEGAVLGPYEAFVDELGERLRRVPSLDRVEYRVGDLEELVEAVLPNAVLFLDETRRRELAGRLTEESLVARARELRRLIATPQSLVLEDLIRLDPAGLSSLFLDQINSGAAGLSLDWTSGYLLSRDRRMLLLLGKPRLPPQEIEFTRGMLERVEAEVAATLARWGELAAGDQPPPEVALGGRYPLALGDASTIRSDMVVNIVTSMVGVLLLFLFAFRRFGVLLYAFVPLSCGLALTFGFTELAYGSLNPATSGFAALLIGLGIDFVIVSYGRYVEERQAGRGLSEALVRVNRSSGKAVVVGAVTSAATFYSFAVTEFTGLRQMGLLTGTGILFCMIAVVALLPALLAWSADRHHRRARAPRLYLHGFGTTRLVRFSMRHPGPVLAVALGLTLLAALQALELRFDDSVQSMRPSKPQGAAVRDEISERFEAGFDTMMLVIQGSSAEEVLQRAAAAAAAARALQAEGVLNGVEAITSVLPPPRQQQEALEWLRRNRRAGLDPEGVVATLTAALDAEGLRPEAFARGLELLGQALSRNRPIAIREVEASPQGARLLERYLRQEQEDGVWKSVVYLHPPPMVWRREPPPQVEELAAELGPGVELTGANVVSEYLRQQVLRDAVVAAALGFVLVAILLWLDYRRIGDTLLSLAPLVLGILWMLGGMVVLDLAMNFMNIFVSTMIIGIGVDYGVHIIHRYRETEGEGRAALESGVRETGKAIVMAALSTVVGFGSLSLSHYPGLRSMGLVAIMGALCTSFVAITVLPAYLSLRVARNERKRGS